MRIIGGQFRGRTIRAPEGMGTRPTSDRVREAIFNILGDVPVGVNVLDLFAGSGAMGLEALSRGAESAIFVDESPDARDVISSNAAALGVSERCLVLGGDAGDFLARQSPAAGKCSLVFVDPPYGEGFPDETLRGLMNWEGLASPAIVVVETARSSSPALEESEAPDEKLVLMRKRLYSDTAVHVFRWSDGGEKRLGT